MKTLDLDMIEGLKNNMRPFGLLTLTAQEYFKAVGKENTQIFDGTAWYSLANDTPLFYSIDTYRIKADYQYEPEHKWMHGDVFEAYDETILICIVIRTVLRVFCVSCDRPIEYDVDLNLNDEAKFLFNVKDKI